MRPEPRGAARPVSGHRRSVAPRRSRGARLAALALAYEVERLGTRLAMGSFRILPSMKRCAAAVLYIICCSRLAGIARQVERRFAACDNLRELDLRPALAAARSHTTEKQRNHNGQESDTGHCGPSGSPGRRLLTENLEVATPSRAKNSAARGGSFGTWLSNVASADSEPSSITLAATTASAALAISFTVSIAGVMGFLKLRIEQRCKSWRVRSRSGDRRRRTGQRRRMRCIHPNRCKMSGLRSFFWVGVMGPFMLPARAWPPDRRVPSARGLLRLGGFGRRSRSHCLRRRSRSSAVRWSCRLPRRSAPLHCLGLQH